MSSQTSLVLDALRNSRHTKPFHHGDTETAPHKTLLTIPLFSTETLKLMGRPTFLLLKCKYVSSCA
jgi:hypothetical protein